MQFGTSLGLWAQPQKVFRHQPGQFGHVIRAGSVTGRFPEREEMLLYFTHTTSICMWVALHSGRRSLADQVLATTGDVEDVRTILGDQHLERSKPYPADVRDSIRRSYGQALT